MVHPSLIGMLLPSSYPHLCGCGIAAKCNGAFHAACTQHGHAALCMCLSGCMLPGPGPGPAAFKGCNGSTQPLPSSARAGKHRVNPCIHEWPKQVCKGCALAVAATHVHGASLRGRETTQQQSVAVSPFGTPPPPSKAKRRLPKAPRHHRAAAYSLQPQSLHDLCRGARAMASVGQPARHAPPRGLRLLAAQRPGARAAQLPLSSIHQPCTGICTHPTPTPQTRDMRVTGLPGNGSGLEWDRSSHSACVQCRLQAGLGR